MTATRTTEKTGMNHGIHGTINVTLIKVRAIIDGPPTTVAESLTLNLEGLSHTLNRGTIRTTNGLTPRLHVSPLIAQTLPRKTTEEKQATRRWSPVSNVTNRAITLPNARPMIDEKHMSSKVSWLTFNRSPREVKPRRPNGKYRMKSDKVLSNG